MPYTTVYDLSTQPPLNWRGLWLPLGLAVAASICAYYARPGAGRYGLLIFAFVAVLVAIGIPYWDYYHLTGQQPQLAEGLVAEYWEKKWTERRDNKNRRYSYEGFKINQVSFAYFRDVGEHGFTNTAPFQYRLRDGLPARIHYVPERQLDDGSIHNRIVKLEVDRTLTP